MYTEKFLRDGWVVIDFPETKPIYEARDSLFKALLQLNPKCTSLEEYHMFYQDDSEHTQTQIQLTEFYRSQKFGKAIAQANLPVLTEFVGTNIAVQQAPYLRMARPLKKQDNIGYHRDTFYGGSPYEVSMVIPFVDLCAEESLQVLSGSHILAEDYYNTTITPSEDVKKNSPKHKLGFLYSPKVMDPSIEKEMVGVPLKVGQALLFSLSLVHGSLENRGNNTRWTTDIRIVNPLAPVDLSDRPTYYEPLQTTCVTDCAREYFHNSNLVGV